MSMTAATSSQTNLPAWDARLGGSLKMNGNKQEDDAKLKKACMEMEAVFLNMLLKTMRSTVPKSEISGNSNHTETLQSMTDMELTRNMAAAGGTGIAAMMYRNLTNLGVKSPTSAAAAAKSYENGANAAIAATAAVK